MTKNDQTPTASLRRFWEWHDAEKPTTENAFDKMTDNVCEVGKEALDHASLAIDERANGRRVSFDDECDRLEWCLADHPEALRDLSLALCEALERMYAQVPEGPKEPIRAELAETIPGEAFVTSAESWVAAGRSSKTDLLLDQMTRTTRDMNERLAAHDEVMRKTADMFAGEGCELDAVPHSLKVEPSQPTVFADCDPAKHTDPSVPEGHVGIRQPDGSLKMVLLEPDRNAGRVFDAKEYRPIVYLDTSTTDWWGARNLCDGLGKGAAIVLINCASRESIYALEGLKRELLPPLVRSGVTVFECDHDGTHASHECREWKP